MKKVHQSIMASLLLLTGIFHQQLVKGQGWTDVAGGMGDWVNAMTVYNGELIVGGRFTTAGGVPANHIARFNGTSWAALGGGVDGWVNALCVYNGELFAGGNFSNADGQPVNFIARWNGTAWSDVSGGTNSIVAALTVYNNKLIVGGYFTDAEGVPVNYIGAWDDNGWYTLGTGMGGSQGQVMALTTYGSDLIAAGFFSSAGGSPAAHIAKWNGSTWSTLGSGISSIVYSLNTYGTDLIAGGYYNSAGGSPAASIARWNGTSWSTLGSGMGALPAGYNYVFALEVMNNHLYAGGMFLTAGGVTVNGIAMWNGSAWSGLNGGVYYGGSNAYGVNALTLYNAGLYAGGLFTTAGSLGVAHIARWTEAPLPVTLTEFTVVKESRGNRLRWKTESESRLDKYYLQRGHDASHFDRLATIYPNGQTGRYEWFDDKPFGQSYYQLQEVEIDGSVKNLQVIYVSRFEEDIILNQNLVDHTIYITAKRNFGMTLMQLLDIKGSAVLKKRINLFGDIQIDIPTLPGGMYFVEFVTENEKHMRRIMIR